MEKSLTDKQIVFMFKCLNEQAGSLRPNDLDWAIKMEEAYKRQGHLSEKQQEILSGIFSRSGK